MLALWQFVFHDESTLLLTKFIPVPLLSLGQGRVRERTFIFEKLKGPLQKQSRQV